MACPRCASENQKEFGAEINIHHQPGLDRLDEPDVLRFPKLVVCGRCGLAEFTLHESDLRMLFSVTAEDELFQRGANRIANDSIAP